MEDTQEYFWGCELTKEKPSVTWASKEKQEEDEEEDSDYLVHTLFLKHAVLGTSAVKAERNVVQIETEGFEKNTIKMTLLSLTLGQSDMCNLDVSFGGETPVKLTLVEGTGPVCIAGQQLTEFPSEDFSQDESALDTEGELEEEETKPVSKKRKAPAKQFSKSKKGKMDESVSSGDDSMDDEDEDEEEEDEDEEDEEDMEEEDIESSPEKPPKKKGKKGKVKDKELLITVKQGKTRRTVKAKRRIKNKEDEKKTKASKVKSPPKKAKKPAKKVGKK